MSQSQRLTQRSHGPSQGSQTKGASTISSGELNGLARAAVRFLLMNDFNKVPIKHSDIVKYVTKGSSKNTTQVMALSAKILKETYGIKLLNDALPNKHYILVNDLPYQDHLSLSVDTKVDMTLLAIILSFIFMQTNGSCRNSGVEQGKVFNFLRLLDIDPKEQHDYFGDIKRSLENFKSQRYLDLIKIENTDPVKFEYRWGMRAMEEVSPRAALEFASEMYGRDSIETWAAHYKAVKDFETTTTRH